MMDKLEQFIKLLADGKWAVAGFIGALVSMPFQKDVNSAREKIVFVFSGSAYSYYLTGMVCEYFNTSPSSAGGIGFLLGAFGGSLTSAILKAIESADIWSLVKKRFGGDSE